jgi:hypothetical protein
LVLKAEANSSIGLDGGISGGGTVKKQGSGETIFRDSSIVNLTGQLNIEGGVLRVLTSQATVNNAAISNGAKLSLSTGTSSANTLNVGALTIGGEIELDVNFTNKTADKIKIVGGNLTFASGALLRIVSFGQTDSSEIVIMNGTYSGEANLSYDSDTYDLNFGDDAIKIKKYTPWDIFVNRYEGNAIAELDENIEAIPNDRNFQTPYSTLSKIKGNNHIIDSNNIADLYFEFSGETVVIENIEIKNFNRSSGNGGAILAQNSSHLTISGNVFFEGNKANGKNNDVYLDSTSDLILEPAASKSITFNGGILGNGNIKQEGAGDIVFGRQAEVDFRGSLEISSGTARFFNAASIDVVNVNNEGTLSLGGLLSIDNIDIFGTLEIMPGGKISVENSALLNNQSSITISGFSQRKVNIVILEGDYTGKFGYLIVAAGAGSKSRISADYSHEKIITLRYEDLTLATIGNLTSNQAAAAQLIDRDPVDGPLYSLASAISEAGNEADIKAALGQVSGEFFTFVAPKALDNNLDAIYSRLNLNTVEETGFDHKEVWTQVAIKADTNKDDEISAGEAFKSDGLEAQLGIDLWDNGEGSLGGAFAGFGGEKFTQGGNSGSLSEYLLGIYGGSFGDKFHVSGALAFSYMMFETQRNLSFAQLNPKANFNAYGAKFGGEVKMITQMQVLGGFLAPFLSANGAYMSIPEISEDGGGAANLTVKPSGLSDIKAQVGLGLERFEGLFKWSVRVYGGLGFIGKGNYEASFSQAKDLGTMNIDGPQGGAFLIGMKAGAEYGFNEYFSAFLNSGYEQAGQTNGYRFGIGLNYKI